MTFDVLENEMKSHFSLLIMVTMLTSVLLHAVTAADSSLGTPAALAEQYLSRLRSAGRGRVAVDHGERVDATPA